MVLVFGVDVPLVELILAFSLITFIMLLEVTIVMIIMFYQMRRSKETTEHLVHLTHVMLHITQKEKQVLDRLAGLKAQNGNGHVQRVKVEHNGGHK